MKAAIVLTTLLALAPPAWAQGDAHAAKTAAAGSAAEQQPFGIAGDPARVSRTLTFDMTGRMRFDPSHLEVKRGETLRFVARNGGSVMHEMVLCTMKELEEHAALMR